ncbi:serine/threonine protein kinase [Acidovorax sp. BL-A-41-H1]|uniref:serine/threonine protein kinase n=1 Tax=Acidovorax sp. BL-A-41-H1 TaxID=3421102 RepID=UPI003F7B3028
MTDFASPARSADMNHVDALPPGSRLGEFEILSLLGVGGFGMVYKAFDHSLHRAVAIKEYMPSALAGRANGQSLWVRASADQATYQAGLASFVGEARLLAQFDHPSLVKVFRFWQANNTAYMVMPLYSGMTFKQARTFMRAPPSEAWLRKLLWSVLGALRVLHEGKTLHRDISPDNIFLQDNGPPVLLDLGAARHAINDQDRKHTAVLKVNYAPIEQYSDGDEDLRQGPWSDLYSLAAVVYGCLCNDTPLPATLRSIRDRMVPFSRVAKTVKRQFGVEYSAPFVAAVSQSLALRPGDRPQNIDAFLQLMGMATPPEGLDHFDFRADLGDVWVEPAERPGPDVHAITTVGVAAPSAAPAVASAGATSVAQPPDLGVTYRSGARADDAGTAARGAETQGGDTVFIEAGDTVAFEDSRYEDLPLNRFSDSDTTSRRGKKSLSPTRAAGRLARSMRKPGVMVWVALAAALVVVSATGLRWAQGSKPPPDDIITELAERPASAASAAAADAPPTAEAASPPASDAASVPVVDAPLNNAVVPPAVPPAFVGAASAPRATPRTQRRPPAEPVVETVVVQEPPPPPPPPPVVEARPRPAPPPRVPSPQEACADASFLARPMCIHQECQKPSQAGQSICVENRRRYEADEQRRRQTPN